MLRYYEADVADLAFPKNFTVDGTSLRLLCHLILKAKTINIHIYQCISLMTV